MIVIVIGCHIALDLLEDLDRLSLVFKPGQDFDEAAKKRVPADEQEEEYQNRLEKTAGERASASKQPVG
jgi:hypothetical protein